MGAVHLSRRTRFAPCDMLKIFESSTQNKQMFCLGPPQKIFAAFFVAGPRGFEPRSLVLETRILPLNYRP